MKPNAPERPGVEAYIDQCKQLIVLDDWLPVILHGDADPSSPELAALFGWFCREPYKKLYAASARLYGEAFVQRPQMADNLTTGDRSAAAGAAALAGLGQGEDSSRIDDKERARLRGQALDWLRADLTARDKLRQDDAKAGPAVQQTLQDWKTNADLAGVRDADALDKLPEAERTAWRKLWTDVDALLAQLSKAKGP